MAEALYYHGNIATTILLTVLASSPIVAVGTLASVESPAPPTIFARRVTKCWEWVPRH